MPPKPWLVVWVDNYIEGLSESEKGKVKVVSSKTSFRFGDENEVVAKENITLPERIGRSLIFISADVVEKDLPLLLSREAMKNAKMKVDFCNSG